MDDTLAQPKSSVPKEDSVLRDDADSNSSGDEDGGLDWSKIPKGSSVSRPVIPKRGEKDFEPAQGSNLQLYQLDRARTAMFDVLRIHRSVASKSMSYAVWHPAIARAHVTTARGVDLASMGHTVARSSSSDPTRMHKRLELLPEEALYLVEKGTLLCWKAVEGFEIKDDEVGGTMLGAPMSVQEAFATMLDTEGITLERYQVYSYLRRLGFVVTRAKQPSKAYPLPAPYQSFFLPSVDRPPFLSHLISSVLWPFKRIFRAFFLPVVNWWRPITHKPWLFYNMDYATVYKSLRLIPSGHSTPLHTMSTEPDSPYEVFYHLYKPPTPFKKSAPPAPDFSVVVVKQVYQLFTGTSPLISTASARTSPIPTLVEFDRLFADQPVLPPPLPRQRKPPPKPEAMRAAQAQVTTPAIRPVTTSAWMRFLSPFLSRRAEVPTVPQRRVNPFMALRQGNRTIVIAAVDGGVASFFRFGQGAFEEWPMA
ncbi:tRNA-splicing endonuclease subunit sen54 N-term-domain-containing protein [Vararia minispora EC-137]|uniref:tRNA-splicing endonuclease subunit sen54 N-term-domain-containing protein n=1 Tax=Vararia minispora EC-137 TaxID=1314806 RepID=A0ACB8QTN6_9AGAM|nr:tRNA-splicing endonuclease subunit sen54 N-term-domain-containing protein [Vararia minispora EC-137]